MEFDEIVVVLEVCNTAVISFFDFALVVSKFCAIDLILFKLLIRIQKTFLPPT